MDGAARRYSLKTQKLNPHRRDRKKNRARPPSVPGSGQRRTIIVTEPPDMLADVHAKFGGRPPRSRRAARPPSWRRRRDRPLCFAWPAKHVLLPLKGCAAAHATRAARLTASSRRAVVRRLTTCPAQYHAGRVVRPQPVFGMVGGCVDRHFPLWTVLLFFVCRRAETAVHVDGL